MKAPTKKLLGGVQYIFLLLLLLLMPFHAFFTTWAGTSFGYRAYWQVWKEGVLLLMVLTAVVLTVADRKFRHSLWDYRPNRLIGLYILLHALLLGFYRQTDFSVLLALKTNVEFLVLFVVAQAATFYNGSNKRLRQIENIILAAGGVVVAFGLAQIFLLPTDVLSHFGYRAETIRPYLLIQDSTRARILSTLGGPNQLGQYLLIPMAILIRRTLQKHNWRWAYLAAIVPFTIVLINTFSRSAWIGLVAVTVTSVLLLLNKKKALWVLIAAILAGIIAIGLAFSKIPQLSQLSSYIFHSPIQKALQESSDSDRLEAYSDSLLQIKDRPLGMGPGSSGPASFYSTHPRVNENYYFQIAVETGVVGLMMFGLLMLMLARDLKVLSNKYELAIPLLTSFIGIAVINLFLHGWTDSTTALIWWGAAGALIGGRR